MAGTAASGAAGGGAGLSGTVGGGAGLSGAVGVSIIVAVVIGSSFLTSCKRLHGSIKVRCRAGSACACGGLGCPVARHGSGDGRRFPRRGGTQRTAAAPLLGLGGEFPLAAARRALPRHRSTFRGRADRGRPDRQRWVALGPRILRPRPVARHYIARLSFTGPIFAGAVVVGE